MKTRYILKIGICFLFCFALFLCLPYDTVNAVEFTEDGYPIYLITYGGSMPYYTYEDLIERSDLVAVGHIVRKEEAKWSCTEDGKQPEGVQVKESINGQGDKVFDYSLEGVTFPPDTIYTDMVFLIEKSYKGDPDSQEIIIRSFSGTVGAFRMNDGGLNAQDYKEGEEMMLFLRKDSGSTKDIGPEHYVVLSCGVFFPQEGVFMNSFDEKVQFVENKNGVFVNSFDENGKLVGNGNGVNKGVWFSFNELMKSIFLIKK